MEYISLSEIATYKQGKQVPVEDQFLICEAGMKRFVRIIDFTNPSEPPRYIKDLGAQYEVDEKCIIMIRYGSQTAGTIVRGISGIIANNMFQVCINDDRFDIDFMYYYLSSPSIKNMLMGGQSSSTMPAITFGMMKQIQVPIRPLDEQKKIAAFLSALERKIKNNEAINRNLSEQAMAIYQEMILDGADDCREGVLSDIADIIMGQSPKGDTYNETGEGEVFYQGRAEFGDRFPTRRLFTTSPKRMAKENSILMSVRAPVGDINVAYEKCCIGRGLCSIASKDNHQSFVLYTMYSLKEQFDIYNGEGTVFGSINKASMNGMTIQIPRKEIMDKFEEIVGPIDSMIKAKYDENCRLVAMRDSLLPKLMSGELDVSELEI